MIKRLVNWITDSNWERRIRKFHSYKGGKSVGNKIFWYPQYKCIVEFTYDGEGNSGHFDPSDPNDFPHLRFTIYELEGWISTDSYCCELSVKAKPKVMQKLSEHIAMASLSHFRKDAIEALTWVSEDELNV